MAIVKNSTHLPTAWAVAASRHWVASSSVLTVTRWVARDPVGSRGTRLVTSATKMRESDHLSEKISVSFFIRNNLPHKIPLFFSKNFFRLKRPSTENQWRISLVLFEKWVIRRHTFCVCTGSFLLSLLFIWFISSLSGIHPCYEISAKTPAYYKFGEWYFKNFLKWLKPCLNFSS